MVGRDVRPTPEGGRVAGSILERHRFFESMLLEAGVGAKIASEEACRMEHCLSEDSFKKLSASLGDRGPKEGSSADWRGSVPDRPRPET